MKKEDARQKVVRQEDLDKSLIEAVSEGCVEKVKLSLQKGANVHAYEDLALLQSAKDCFLDDRVEIAQILLQAGANVHADDEEALYWAIEYDNIEMVNLLLEAGANVHASENFLIKAASSDSSGKIVQLLLDAGADVHAYEDLALYDAVDKCNTEAVKVLLRAGADIDSWDVLRVAAFNGDVETAKVLIEAGADDFFVIKNLALEDDVKGVQTLVEAGVNIRAEGDMILALLARRGEIDMMKMFLRLGSRPDETTLSWAASSEEAEKVQILLKAGACPSWLTTPEIEKFLTPDFILSSSGGVSWADKIEKCHPELREKYHWSEKKTSLKSIREEKIFEVKMVMLDLYYRPGETAYYRAITF